MDGEVLLSGRFDVYRCITENIVAAIEAGPGVFRMPWHWMSASGGRPVNALTGRFYRGVNVVMLWAEARMRGFDSCHWATYRQWRELGGQVRWAERSATIVFYKTIEVEAPQGREGEDGEPPSTRLDAFGDSGTVQFMFGHSISCFLLNFGSFTLLMSRTLRPIHLKESTQPRRA